ncbi:hypothetical protein FA10DRAFT_270058 [Acaromyces ingoldii]|uniref:Uncharacterized protein n=1 Tax=Acaromyces ingoldii TaxID=215250 RepID=A0A316Y9Y6_9BASI|nr:hypothetical protein FA10DRAFT_270058 [Acaromyces ingoldii]PWN86690.1 hypothetical protein FA10DRAFT_270058 [Acaromyces ingoldii]
MALGRKGMGVWRYRVCSSGSLRERTSMSKNAPHISSLKKLECAFSAILILSQAEMQCEHHAQHTSKSAETQD